MVKPGTKNFVRQIREAARMSQTDFARAIGRSLQMVRLYEHGQDTPAEVREKLRSIATQAGRDDLAAALTTEDFIPGETRTPPTKPAKPNARREQYHALLDEILDSGDPDALNAVIPNLVLFGKWIRSKGSERPPRKRE